MYDNEYKIVLGVEIDTSDIQSQIDKASQKSKPTIEVDANISKVEDKLDGVQQQIKDLGKGKTKTTLDITCNYTSSNKTKEHAIINIYSGGIILIISE